MYKIVRFCLKNKCSTPKLLYNRCGNLIPSKLLSAVPLVALNELNELKNVSVKESLAMTLLNNVHAASSLLTTTLFLLEKTCFAYKEHLKSLIGIMDDCMLQSNNGGGWNEDLWQEVIEVRHEVNATKEEFTWLVNHMETVDKIVTATIEATFNIDSDYLCSTLCQHHHLAQEKLKVLHNEVQQVEELYLLTQIKFAKYKET